MLVIVVVVVFVVLTCNEVKEANNLIKNKCTHLHTSIYKHALASGYKKAKQ